MDIILWIIIIGIAVYFQHYTLAAVIGAMLISLIGAGVMQTLKAEIKKCNMITTDVVVSLLRKDIAEPEALRKSLEEQGELHSQRPGYRG